MNKMWIALGVGAIVLLGGIAALALRSRSPSVPSPVPMGALPTPAATPLANAPSSPAASGLVFATPKKSAHFESSTPAHETILPAPPTNVVIDFNFDLATNSAISITKDGKDYGVGPVTIDANKLAMRRTVDPSAPDGLYTVTYTACWPDKSCHDGHFQFAIERAKISSALDLRGQSSVEIHLKDIAFVPPTIRIQKGTRVRWVNDDAVEHYVNTDAHPSHTYFPAQNSRALKKGDAYVVTFSVPGAYPYHCSAHADTMRGMIVVE